MAYSYKSPDRDQLFLLPPSVRDWLPQDHLVFFVLDAVDLLELSAFDAKHPNDGVGRRAYNPKMMLALLVYAYCLGVRSSRKIAAGCRTDLAFKVICCDVVPAHDAIGEFRTVHEKAIEDLFCDVLRLCARAGLATLGEIAIDGTKIGSDASLEANRSATWIRSEVEKILAEAKASDEKEASQGLLYGDEPRALLPKGSRRARLEAALQEVQAEEEARRKEAEEQAAKARAEADEGRRLRGRKPKDPAKAAARAQADIAACERKLASASEKAAIEAVQSALEAARARFAEAKAKLASGEGAAEPRVNLTDPTSRIMKTQDSWVQGYNCQAAVNEHQVVVACDATQDHNDVDQLVPMMTRTEETAALAGIEEPIGRVLADAGYWSEANATAPGPDRLLATRKDWKQRREARELGTTSGPPPPDASPLEAMEHRLRTEEGASAYARRKQLVEPMFGQAKENRGIRRFMRRGLIAARSEWSLVCTTSNLSKLFSHAGGRSLAEVLLCPAP